ncbi:error-prone DNA polymerase [Pelagerythrobacter rhizovicinus]|uniref:Error-prone DNA polymerase n=1 Tax=Pelagerythrobacter rhizovicinus TaxID=2268576 RepID=A0A4Q2KRG7_9SPHN|nr:error-prone DNA polymerase [Pelagerythrobacter rhizovicinus]RXZ66253.1 error-prone DNA polymerase [Pelagerythrobacter rhizovicinus]
MPDTPITPGKRRIEIDPDLIDPPQRAPFVELGLVSCFSFLRGASDAVDLVSTARELGYDAIGIADANSMAGVVRIHTAAKVLKLRPVIGCRIETVEGLSFLAYPTDRAAYGRLCRLISAGRMNTLDGKWQDKGVCDISLAMLADHAEGVQLILLPPDDLAKPFTIPVPNNVIPFPAPDSRAAEDISASLREITEGFTDLLPHLVSQFPTLRHLAASYLYSGDDIARIDRLDALAKANGLALLATNDVHYHAPDRRPLQDVMTAIRHKTTVAEAGHLLFGNAERHLKSPDEMLKLFARWPHAIAAAREVADACTFNLEELQYEYPEEIYPDGMTPQQYLEKSTWEGARRHYLNGVPDSVRQTLERELALIEELKLARYFLTIRDIVEFARTREKPILCQGRGSAANSAVCFCLGITAVDPAEHQLLFERFISAERNEPPDIDVDFEHERREEVIQHIYEKYGRDRAGLCATVIHYRPRMAIREVGKAMGLSEDVTSALARTVWGGHGRKIDENHVMRETGLDLSDPHLRRVLKLTEQMIGMPRHLSQHVGGFILTQGPLIETVPIGNGAMPDRTFIEWDKDDIDDLGILKVDVLALGMLTCIRKCFDLLEKHCERSLELATVPREDPAVYDMLCNGDSIGVFQVESRAQMNMLPRLRPRKFYDLVVEVAIVRPGPIQGDMVHPYLKRRKEQREGKTAFALPAPAPEHGPQDELSSILGRTLGVPIFQEQAMKIAIDAAEFTPIEANRLRKAMATFRSRGKVDELEERMVSKMIERGYDPEFAERCFNQIKGFGEYGFPESHAASFAHLVYVSSWLKCHYPAAFACGLLNSQPMGFYAPAQIVRDAQAHGVTVLPIDVNASGWDCTLESCADQPFHKDRLDGHIALRLGLRQVDGLPEHVAAALVDERVRNGPYRDVADLRDRAKVPVSHIERLASADCFGSLELSRRQALWDARSLVAAPDLPLFRYAEERDEGAEKGITRLPRMPLGEEVVTDYQTTRLSLKAHPMSFLRAELSARGFVRACDLRTRKYRSIVNVAGVVLIRQRPGSAKGVCFITLEDETGVVNLVVWPDLMERQRTVVMGARLMEVRGRVEYDDEVIHVIASDLVDATGQLRRLSDDILNTPVAYGDHCKNAPPPKREFRDDPHLPVQPWEPPSPDDRECGFHQGHPRNVRIIPKSRDFH